MYYNYNDKTLISLDNLRRVDIINSTKDCYIRFTYCDNKTEAICVSNEQNAKIKLAVIHKMLKEKNS